MFKMKLVNIIISLIVLTSFCSVIVFGANPSLPNEPSTALINKVDSEHKNTRLYLKNQLIEREKAFIEEFTKRGDYYENALDDMMKLFILRVSLVFGGIIIFVSAFNLIIRNKLEKKRYKVFLESLTEDVKQNIKKDFDENIEKYVKLPQNDINEFNMLNNINQQSQPQHQQIQPQTIKTPIQQPIQQQKMKTDLFTKFKINNDDFKGVQQ